MKPDKDILGEAITRLKREALSQQVPEALVEETLRRLGDAGMNGVGHPEAGRIAIGGTIRLALAAAALVAVGCMIGRLSRPAPVNIDKLREAITPSLAASIEPVLRAKVVEDLQRRWQLALTAVYVKVREELTEQYQDDLNRFAFQTLAASNAKTNQLLAELLESIDAAQARDLNRIGRVISEIERNRIQDMTQLAAGLQTLASRTEETRQVVQLLVDVLPEDLDAEGNPIMRIPNERNEP